MHPKVKEKKKLLPVFGSFYPSPSQDFKNGVGLGKWLVKKKATVFHYLFIRDKNSLLVASKDLGGAVTVDGDAAALGEGLDDSLDVHGNLNG